MKAGLFVAAAALTQLAIAQPHHRVRHQHLHEKKNVVVEVEIVTATAPDAVVYVNANGEPVSTSFVNAEHAATTSAAAVVATPTTAVAEAAVQATSSAAAVVQVVQSSAAAVVAVAAATKVKTSAAASVATSSAAAASSSSSGSSSYGLTYSPYNADGSCKTSAQVSADFDQLDNYSMVRLYGIDCNQLNTVGPAAVAKGMKLMLGVYDIGSVASETGDIITYANGDWSNIDTVSIGNELINSEQASVATVVAGIQTARALLKAAGFTGNVVTVDTYAAVINNPELCEASDYAAVNAHAFFDSDTTAAQAGTWVANTVADVKAACSGKTVVVTESGWPSQGDSNGAAVPSEANQAAAISSLKSAFSSNPAGIVLFTAYNDLWKSNFDGSFGAEQYWGMYGTSSE